MLILNLLLSFCFLTVNSSEIDPQVECLLIDDNRFDYYLLLKNVGDLEKFTDIWVNQQDKIKCKDLSTGQFYFLKDVKLNDLRLENYTGTEVPKIIFEGGNLIKDLTIKNSGIKFISKETFGKAKNLESLDLSHGAMEEIAAKQFEDTKLKIIDFSHNKIENIHESAFVNFHHAIIITLTGNKLKKFHQNVLHPFKKLNFIQINLESNAISEIDYLPDKENLLGFELNFAKNELKSVTINNIATHLNFSNNKISELKCSQDVSNVEVLDLSHNLISSDSNLNSCMEKLVNLKVLRLSNNQFSLNGLGFKIFTKLTKLEQLSLSGLMQLSYNTIPFGLFNNQPNLEILDLSFTGLYSFELFALISLKSLRVLNLSGNKRIVSSYNFQNIQKALPALQFIGLEDTNIRCECLGILVTYLRLRKIEIMEVKNKIENNANVLGMSCNRNSDNQRCIPL